jgi:creatine kinase
MSKALLGLSGELRGDYYPLACSNSYIPKPGGMSAAEEEKMREDHFLFQEPDSTLLLASGMGRHWPDGRGIFANDAKNFLVWANEEDHTRIISMEMGADIKAVFERFVMAVNMVEASLQKESYGFMHNDHLGFILVCPSNLGTGLRASVMLKIPLVSARPDFKMICGGMKLQARGGAGVDSGSAGGIWDISNSDRLGISEVDLVNTMIEGCSMLVAMEQALESGKPAYEFMPGLGDTATPGFSSDECPDKMPDLSHHNNIMAEVLRSKPSIYDSLKNKKTKLGVTLAQCIKTGMDNKGHPMIKTVGMTAGDEDSYEVFKELFDPVIDIRHGGYGPTAKHPTDLDVTGLSRTNIDPSGKYVISTRVRTGRSIRGLRLPPTCSKNERREVERIFAKSLLGLTGELKGDYHPLAYSQSYIPKPGGMSMAEEEKNAKSTSCSRSRTRRCCSRPGWAGTGPTPAGSSGMTRRTSSYGRTRRTTRASSRCSWGQISGRYSSAS